MSSRRTRLAFVPCVLFILLSVIPAGADDRPIIKDIPKEFYSSISAIEDEFGKAERADDPAKIKAAYLKSGETMDTILLLGNLIDVATSIAEIETLMGSVQSLWYQEETRKIWDSVSDVVGGIGFISLGVSQVVQDQSAKETTAIAGAVVAGIAVLSKLFFSEKAPVSFEESFYIVEMSRKAYDDMNERRLLISSTSSGITAYLSNAKTVKLAIQKSYDTPNVAPEAMKEVVQSVKVEIDQFDAVVGSLAGYFDKMLSMDSIELFKKGVEKYPKVKQMEPTYKSILGKIQGARDKYVNEIIAAIKKCTHLDVYYAF